MRPITAILCLTCLAFACALAAISLRHEREAPAPVAPPAVTSRVLAAPASGASAAEIAALRREIASLREAVAALSTAEVDPAAAAPAPRDAAEAVAPEAGPEAPPDPEAMQQKIQEERTSLEDRLAAEPPDSAWSLHAEGEIRARLEERAIEGARLTAATCGASLCRLEFEFEDAPAGHAALGMIPFLLPTKGGGQIFADPDSPQRAVVFAERFAPAS